MEKILAIVILLSSIPFSICTLQYQQLNNSFIPKNAHHIFQQIQTHRKTYSIQNDQLNSFINHMRKFTFNDIFLNERLYERVNEMCLAQIDQLIKGDSEWVLRSCCLLAHNQYYSNLIPYDFFI